MPLKGKDTLTLSSDMIGKTLMATSDLVRELSLLSHRVNTCIKVGDPIYYSNLLEFRRRHCNTHAAIEAYGTIDPLLMEGRELLYNVRLPTHTDRQDPRRSMAVFTVFGDFTGGYLLYPSLGFRVRFDAGDVNSLRGRIVHHEVEDFEGQRISIPHFTHTSCWRSVSMAELVD
jgi:hypothetical protein